MSSIPTQLVRAESRALVKATLHLGLTAEALFETEQVWGPFRRGAVRRLVQSGYPEDQIPRHWHWDWGRKSGKLDYLAYRCYGVECERKMEGLMLVALEGPQARSRLAPDAGKPLVYVDYLEAAPWNVKPLVESPLFAGIGMLLMRVAVQVSMEEGFRGRVGLHALPQAEDFYRDKCGMACLGADPDYQNLPYYELTAEAAKRFVTPKAK